jgi:hypothetical protein
MKIEFLNMPAQISFELKGAILAFHSLKVSLRKILDQLLIMGKTVALSTVQSVITQEKEEDSGRLKPPKKLATHQ